MNNNYNNIRKLRERVLKNFYPVYHAPLVFDIGTQTFFRKDGYVSWPENKVSKQGRVREEVQKLRSESKVYFAYPKGIS